MKIESDTVKEKQKEEQLEGGEESAREKRAYEAE